jgi:RNA polymerase sigma-70 factor (ECF subfamily)
VSHPDRAPRADHAGVASLVRDRVRCRFQLTADDFADIIIATHARQPGRRAIADFAAALSLDDLYLATACARSDEDAWREFRDRFFNYLGDFARRFLPAAAAEDVRDQLIADLWQRQRLGQYDGRSTLRTWLGALVTHASINARRSAQRTETLTAATLREPRVPADREDDVARREFAVRVNRTITGLDAESKLLLLLYYEQGLTLEQMSTVLNASKATLSRRLTKTRDALRAAIDAMTDDRQTDATATARHHLDLSRLEWDLAGALGWAPQKNRGSGV